MAYLIISALFSFCTVDYFPTLASSAKISLTSSFEFCFGLIVCYITPVRSSISLKVYLSLKLKRDSLPQKCYELLMHTVVANGDVYFDIENEACRTFKIHPNVVGMFTNSIMMLRYYKLFLSLRRYKCIGVYCMQCSLERACT